MDKWSGKNKLNIKKVSTPIGVIGIIYESRPNVTADVSALCLKSGEIVQFLEVDLKLIIQIKYYLIYLERL